MAGMFYIICYDTPSNKRRRKLHKILKNFAGAVQESVFETILEGPRFDEMMTQISKIGDESVDSVRIYRMTREAQKQMTIIGMPGMLEEQDHIMVSHAALSEEHFKEAATTEAEADDELPEWL